MCQCWACCGEPVHFHLRGKSCLAQHICGKCKALCHKADKGLFGLMASQSFSKFAMATDLQQLALTFVCSNVRCHNALAQHFPIMQTAFW